MRAEAALSGGWFCFTGVHCVAACHDDCLLGLSRSTVPSSDGDRPLIFDPHSPVQPNTASLRGLQYAD